MDFLNRALARERVRKNGFRLQFLKCRYQDDKGIVSLAVQQNGLSLAWASKGLQNDKEIVAQAVHENFRALRYASYDCRNDRGIVILALQRQREQVESGEGFHGSAFPSVLGQASPSLRNDKQLVLMAVGIHGFAIRDAFHQMKEDKQVIQRAVQTSGQALQFLSPFWKNDEEIVSLAVQQNGEALSFASKACRNRREIVSLAVRKDGMALSFASNSLRADRDIVSLALQQNGKAFVHISDNLREDARLIGIAIQNISPDLAFPGREEDSTWFWRTKCILCFKKKLFQIFAVLFEEERCSRQAIDFAETNWALSEKWKGPCYETLWLVGLCLGRGQGGLVEIITQYSSGDCIPERIRTANDLADLVPILTAFAHVGVGWKELELNMHCQIAKKGSLLMRSR